MGEEKNWIFSIELEDGGNFIKTRLSGVGSTETKGKGYIHRGWMTRWQSFTSVDTAADLLLWPVKSDCIFVELK